MEFKDIKLLDFGNTIYTAGIVLQDPDKGLIMMIYPDHTNFHFNNSNIVIPTYDEWKEMIRQMDILEVELIDNNPDNKTIIRKTTRQIEQQVSWNVFKRDNYTCRYCGNDNTPLTVDHLILWEAMGPSIEKNLVTACKRCNKKRGNMEYEDWLNSDYYNRVSANITPDVKLQNVKILDILHTIPKRIQKRRR